MKQELTAQMISEIGKWLEDFNKSQPDNVGIDTDTFEGSAYYLLSNVKVYLEWELSASQAV